MKWLALHIDTSPAGLEPVEAALSALGIDGLVIEDEEDFRRFLEQNRQYWDYVDEELDRSMSGKCRVTFYAEENEAGFSQVAAARIAMARLKEWKNRRQVNKSVGEIPRLERELDQLKAGFCKVQAAFPEPVDWQGTGLVILQRQQRGNLASLLAEGCAYYRDGTPIALEADGQELTGTMTVKACSHITGGGFYENIPRMLKDGTRAVIRRDSYPIPPIFGLLARTGGIEEQMMYNTYNMGLGMVLAVDPEDADKAMEAIRAAGETPYVVGEIEAGEKGVSLC